MHLKNIKIERFEEMKNKALNNQILNELFDKSIKSVQGIISNSKAEIYWEYTFECISKNNNCFTIYCQNSEIDFNIEICFDRDGDEEWEFQCICINFPDEQIFCSENSADWQNGVSEYGGTDVNGVEIRIPLKKYQSHIEQAGKTVACLFNDVRLPSDFFPEE